MNRRPELDWLRVVAIAILHAFHVGMMFNTWPWHLKNAETLPALDGPMERLHLVRMPLLMVIAGRRLASGVNHDEVLASAPRRDRRRAVRHGRRPSEPARPRYAANSRSSASSLNEHRLTGVRGAASTDLALDLCRPR